MGGTGERTPENGAGGLVFSGEGGGPAENGKLYLEEKFCYFVFALGIVFFIALTLYAAALGPRGADVYLYIDHVQSLLDGDGIQTNTLFPVSVYPELMPLPRPFLQNMLSVYISLPLALLLGAYHGLIATGLVFYILTSLIIFMSASDRKHRLISLAMGLTFLFFPIVFTTSLQLFAEPTTAILGVLFVITYIKPGFSFSKSVILSLIAVSLFWTRENFILLLAFLPVAFVFHSLANKNTRIGKNLIAIT
jgi:hypothetical protein